VTVGKDAAGAFQLDLERLLGTAAQHQRHFAAGRPAQFLLDFSQRQVVGRVLVDRKDDVAGLDVGGGGGRPVARRDDLDLAVFEGNRDTGRCAVVGGAGLQRLVFVLRQVHRMRVEAGQHAGDRGLHELAVGHRLDGVVADALERLAEQVELLVDAALAAFCLRQGRDRRQKDDQGDRDYRFTHVPTISRGGCPAKASAH
jgi:hypothetical protein